MNDTTICPAPKQSGNSRENDCVQLRVRAYGLTHPGRVRATNEDQFLIAQLIKALHVRQSSLPQPLSDHSGDQSHLFIVADGMGGYAAGETASALAVESVERFVLNTFQWFAKCRSDDEDKLLADFQRALSMANSSVWAEAVAHPELKGMGTTLTLAYSLNDVLFVAHVGDSRCYLSQGGVLYRLTQDHTFVEDLVRRGIISSEAAARHQLRHVMTNAIGGDSPQMRVELHKLNLLPGDVILLCSDGVSEMLTDEEIASILKSTDAPETACHRLVEAANAMGGRDNATAVVVHFLEPANDDGA